MAQPLQQTNGTPEGAYMVIDNSAPGNGGLAGGIGYDTTAPGAISQGKNTFQNGNIPDYIASASKTITALSGVNNTTILFKNPA